MHYFFDEIRLVECGRGPGAYSQPGLIAVTHGCYLVLIRFWQQFGGCHAVSDKVFTYSNWMLDSKYHTPTHGNQFNPMRYEDYLPCLNAYRNWGC